ncbi:MAG: dTDP-4-amino-4,6-dideoxygalactose transaminase [Bacteroidetes bacterium SW_11_45_7]|nr:MAG: dTDP-4-amino-4,6-dideoxygalactose transaminase [Bacteroidetes bacterium SW_11_45_7]
MRSKQQPNTSHIPFNRPTITGYEQQMMNDLYQNPGYFRDRHFHKLCGELLKTWYRNSNIFLTTSCTHALELAVELLQLQKDDEVILPSFTYVSTANAVVNCGARPVFVDIDPASFNMDLSLLQDAITDRTKAIIPVHYSGISCDIDRMRKIIRNDIPIIEDAAHSFLAEHHDQKLGTMGELGCISFDYTKNVSCGHGGMLLVNDSSCLAQAEIAYEIGTDKAKFLRGEKDFFEWAGAGSKYALSELNAAHLYAQLQWAQDITQKRLEAWHYYLNNLSPIAEEHNLQLQNIEATFHYIPLHNSTYGQQTGRFIHHRGQDNTQNISQRMIRLPLFHGITREEQDRVIESIKSFYTK